MSNRSSTQEKFLSAVAEYCAARGIEPSTLGRQVARDGKFFKRLRAGGRMTVDMLDRFYAHMAAHPPAGKSSAESVVCPPADSQNPQVGR